MTAPSPSTPLSSARPPTPARETDATPANAGPSRRTRYVLDRLSVALFVGLFAAAVARWSMEVDGGTRAVSWGLALVLGMGLADAAAGLAHWFADRFFAPTTPGIGPWLIAPFRAHHDDPGSIGRHDFFEVSGSNALACLPLAGALHALPAATDFASSLFGATCLSGAAFLFATNQFHGWAHATSPPAFARALQRAGLVLSPEAHARHHFADHDRAYCVTSGWLNPVLDRTRFFSRLERLLGRSEDTRPGLGNAGGPPA